MTQYKKSTSQLLVPNHNFTDQETEAQIWNEPKVVPTGLTASIKTSAGSGASALVFFPSDYLQLIIVLRMKDESQSHWWPISIYLQEHKCHKYHFYEKLKITIKFDQLYYLCLKSLHTDWTNTSRFCTSVLQSITGLSITLSSFFERDWLHAEPSVRTTGQDTN